MRRSAESEEYQPFRELCRRVAAESRQFTSLPPPESDDEWNSRRRQAFEIRKRWSLQLSALRTGSTPPVILPVDIGQPQGPGSQAVA